MTDNLEQSVEDLDLPFYIFLIVVLFRAFYSGVVTITIVWLVAPLLGLPSVPGVGFGLIVLGQWVLLFTIIGFLVIGIGLKLWIILSWMTASLFSRELRNAVLNVYKQKQDADEGE